MSGLRPEGGRVAAGGRCQALWWWWWWAGEPAGATTAPAERRRSPLPAGSCQTAARGPRFRGSNGPPERHTSIGRRDLRPAQARRDPSCRSGSGHPGPGPLDLGQAPRTRLETSAPGSAIAPRDPGSPAPTSDILTACRGAPRQHRGTGQRASQRPPQRFATISQIHGTTQGLKSAHRRALERTFRRKVAPDQVVSPELARHLAQISREINRQVGVLIDRRGSVTHVIVGDAATIQIPDLGRMRAGSGRFRGLRLVHTHLRGEPLTRDDLNDLALLRLDLVAMVAAEEDGDAGRIELAHLAPSEELGSDAPELAAEDPFVRVEAPDVFRLEFDFDEVIRALEDEYARLLRGRAGKSDTERALVIGVRDDDDHFEETLELVRAAGVTVAGTVRQRRRSVHPRTVVGPGKLTDIVLEGMRLGASVAIFDVDLKPAQARAFEQATELKTIDRTQLILDVFAQRARSRDGKLQVELAQLKYALPRLSEREEGLSRLAGGIGGRGPGETVLEVSRRRVRDRIRTLEKEIDKLGAQRDLRRQRRRSSGIPTLSIIGYTNAGKSTLLNAMTQSEVEAADQLFMTLDPTSRRLRFPREGEVVITDTVGFIAELPEDLVTAFRATLEELADADLLLHVVDASDPHLDDKRHAVRGILEELELDEIPRLLVLNKSDLLDPATARGLATRENGVLTSATKRQGLRELIERAEQMLGGTKSLLNDYGAPAGAHAETGSDGDAAGSEASGVSRG
ncbi:MAG: GTPase HflX [Acidobacteria bacterium]|nr:MAG: GTPase HflX [Acidobacteriota bacterium]REK11336.1 MAG: GTPase HflX [Acidobacteriota bacterium]